MTHTSACDAARSQLAANHTALTDADEMRLRCWGLLASATTAYNVARSTVAATSQRVDDANRELIQVERRLSSADAEIGRAYRDRQSALAMHDEAIGVMDDARGGGEVALRNFGAAYSEWARIEHQWTDAKLTAWTVGRECGCITPDTRMGPWDL